MVGEGRVAYTAVGSVISSGVYWLLLPVYLLKAEADFATDETTQGGSPEADRSVRATEAAFQRV